MFIFIAILFMVCGILLLLKAGRMTKEQGLHIIIDISAILLILLGIVLAYCLFSGKMDNVIV